MVRRRLELAHAADRLLDLARNDALLPERGHLALEIRDAAIRGRAPYVAAALAKVRRDERRARLRECLELRRGRELFRRRVGNDCEGNRERERWSKANNKGKRKGAKERTHMRAAVSRRPPRAS